QLKIDIVRRRTTSHLFDMLAHALTISTHHHVGKNGHLLLCLRIFEQQHRIGEIKVELVLIEDLKRDEVVSFETQMLKRLLQTIRLIVEVGNDHDDATARQYLCELMKRLGEVRFTACLEQREIAEDRTHVSRAITRGNVRVHLLCKRHESDRVL